MTISYTPSADYSATPPPTEDDYKVVNGRRLTQRLELFSHNKESNGRSRFEQSAEGNYNHRLFGFG